MRKALSIVALFITLFSASAQNHVIMGGPPDPPPPPGCLVYATITFPVSADTTVCINSAPLTLVGDTTNSVFSGPHVSNGVFTPTTAGTFKIMYTNADTCIKPDSVNITVITQPTANPAVITGPNDICNDGGLSFFSVAAIQYATAYNWVLQPVGAGTLTTNGTDAMVTWDPAFCGTATISTTATVLCNQTANSQVFSINVKCVPHPVLTVGGPYCQTNEAFQLSADIQGGTWNGCNVTTGGVLTPSTMGSCAVTYSVIQNGCSGFTTQTIEVNQPLEVLITANAVQCTNVPVQISASPQGGTWSTSPALPLNTGVNDFIYTVTGPFGCSGSATATITGIAPPVAAFGYQQTNCKTICLGDQSVNGFSWSWDYGDGATGTEFDDCHTYPDSGTYCITQTATNTCGSDDTTICIFVGCTAIGEEIADNSISFYPNPATAALVVNTGNTQATVIEVFDIAGRKLLSQNITASPQTIDLAGLAEGIYTCIVRTNEKIIRQEKIIVGR